ncbi:hypothetical protein BKA67DRAFT_542489 [Truncatella angustata]|uniref:Xylanolytic transcriptional activator regulatory domain-containing protein n=1 Tax=Truncatella angustata TaxID=152316 RepID=A0A9P8RHN4_9PEZI|nr:uncharacterized protein BKA67DRAFT_542489 [Truncatella angustata]KAH6639958.1 hypothetical protein BKA67DRAFT_542489 [Truncatella angustata]
MTARIECLEARLAYMQDAIRPASLLPIAHDSGQDLQRIDGPAAKNTLAEERSQSDEDKQSRVQVMTTVLEPQGQVPELIQRIQDSHGCPQYQDVVASALNEILRPTDLNVLEQEPDPALLHRLPRYEETRALLDEFFSRAAPFCLLYDQELFLQIVESLYGRGIPPAAEVFANINIALAMCHITRMTRAPVPSQENKKAWMRFRYAISVLPQLLMTGVTFEVVQVLLGIATFLSLNGDTETALPLITAARSLSHQLELFRDIAGTSKTHNTLRRRIFWMTHVMESRACIRSGVDPTHILDNIDMDTLDRAKKDLWIVKDDEQQSEFIQALISLTIMTGQVPSLAQHQAEPLSAQTGVHNNIAALNSDLELWRRRFGLLLTSEAHKWDDSQEISRLWMQISYFHMLMIVDTKPCYAHRGADMAPGSEFSNYDDSITTITGAEAKCIEAARALLEMARHIPRADHYWTWILIHYVFEASSIVFARILEDTHSPACAEDLRRLEMAERLFVDLVCYTQGTKGNVRNFQRLCTGLKRIARDAIKKAAERMDQPAQDSVSWLPDS